MTLPLSLLFCAAACSEPSEPGSAARKVPQVVPSIAIDSACRGLTITLIGSNNVSVTFPDRSTCGSGLVLIPAGAPTRGGPGKRSVSIPVRLLNASDYTIQTPAALVLAPGGRVVLNPAGEPGSKLLPQNADSVRAGTGEWVWLVGAGAAVPVGDSTAVRTLVIRLDSPVTRGGVAFTPEAVQVTAAGWVLLTSTSPAIDTTKVVQQPGTSMEMYRTALIIGFDPSLSDQVKGAFFVEHGLTVLGVTSFGWYYVSFPDPGQSFQAYDGIMDSLRSVSGVRFVLSIFHQRGVIERENGRLPSDELKRVRGSSGRDGWIGQTWWNRTSGIG
jgi:hypothetical protein